MFEIETEQLLLRDFHEHDLLAYRAAGSHPKVLKYYPHDLAEWHRLSRRLVDKFTTESQEVPRLSYTLAVIAEGSLVGAVSIRTDSTEHQQGSIGCQIAYEHWSKGYASEAMLAAISLGFKRLNLHRISAETNSENRRALRLAQRAEMRIEGVLRENKFYKGRWWSTTLLSILRSEWGQP